MLGQVHGGDSRLGQKAGAGLDGDLRAGARVETPLEIGCRGLKPSGGQVGGRLWKLKPFGGMANAEALRRPGWRLATRMEPFWKSNQEQH